MLVIVCISVILFMFVGGGNRLAHALVNRAVLAADIDVWLEELPPDLDDVLQTNFP